MRTSIEKFFFPLDFVGKIMITDAFSPVHRWGPPAMKTLLKSYTKCFLTSKVHQENFDSGDHLQREDVILKQHCRTKLKSIMTWYLFEFQLGMVTLDRLCRLVDFQTLVFGWVPTIPTVFGLTWHWRFHIKFWSDILVILNLKGFQWCRRRQTVVRINGVALLEIKDPNLGLTGVKNDQMSHYFRNLPVNGHDLYDTENLAVKLSAKQ